MRKRFIGSSSIQGVLDNKILYERTDIRELHTIFPSHLITFFNKKGIWKRVQDAKLDLPFMSNVKQLQLLYIILSYQQQPQVCSQYFKIRVVEYSKQLKPLMSAALTKKHQPLLVIAPQGLGLANDYGPEPKSPKHKRNVMIIPYSQINDMHVMVVHPMQNNSSPKKGSAEEQSRKQLQILYTSVQGEELRILVESEKCSQIIRLIQDYMKHPEDVGWGEGLIGGGRPKSLQQIVENIKKSPLQIENPNSKREPQQMPDIQQVYYEVYERLDNFFDQRFKEQGGDTIKVKLKDILGINREGLTHLGDYAYYNLLTDDYELYQLQIIQNFARYFKWKLLKRHVIHAVIKIQAGVRGFIVRKRVIRSLRFLCKNFAARQIQKVFRGFLIRKKIVEYYEMLLTR